MPITTPTAATPLEALPSCWGLFNPNQQRLIFRASCRGVENGRDRVESVARALHDLAPELTRTHSRALATDLAGYRRAIDAEDGAELLTRAAYASVTAAKFAEEKGPPTYRAEQASDGTWTVYSVPVFSAHSDGEGEKKKVFSKAWLEGALQRALVRQAEGYYGPLHVRHHDFRQGTPDADVDAAGKIRFTHVEEIKLGGVPTWTIFADLVGVRPEVYDRIRRGELSYRSIEIIDVRKGEIDSLALLDHEVPFFRFPLLRISEESPQTVSLTKSAYPALAYRAAGDRGLAVLFRYSDSLRKAEHMPNPFAKPDEKPGDKPDEKKMEKPGDKDESMQRMEGGPDPVTAQILQILQAISAKLGIGGGAPAPESAPPSQMSAGPVDVGMPGASMSASDAVSQLLEGVAQGDGESYRAQGAIAAMTGRLEQTEKELEAMRVENRVAKKSASLREQGFTEVAVAKFVAITKEKGETAGLAYADGMAAIGAMDRLPTWADGTPTREVDPPEVAKYQEKGPVALDKARSVFGTWKRTKSQLPLADYLSVNLDSNTYLSDAAGRS